MTVRSGSMNTSLWFFAVLFFGSSALLYPQDSRSLTAIANGKTDKADVHGFTDIYDLFFTPIRSTVKKVCEIGIAWGGSLKVWSQYFSGATIYGIDNLTLDELRSLSKEYNVKQLYLPESPETTRIKTFVADQSNRDQLNSFIQKYGSDFDVILDDGGHAMNMQQISFGFLFKHVKPGGYYVIEDVHTSLPNRYPGFGVQKEEENTTLGMINGFIRQEKIRSVYLTPDEMEYLNNTIEYCNLWVSNNSAHSMTCIFKKKESR